MPKKSTLEVKESISCIQQLIRKSTNSKNVLRLQSLIYIKQEQFQTREELANHLGYTMVKRICRAYG